MKFSVMIFKLLTIFLTFGALCAAQNQNPLENATITSQRDFQDWLVSSDPLAMPIFPAQGYTVKQNPPIFRWPYFPDAEGYVLRLKYPANEVKEFQSEDNFVFLSFLLEPGDYQWQVRMAKSTAWSQWRKFSVGHSTYPFIVPRAQALFEKASQSTRPRSFPKGHEKDQLLQELIAGSRKQGFSSLLTIVNDFLREPSPPKGYQNFESQEAIRITEAIRIANSQTLKLAYSWLVSGEKKFLNAAKKRALNLAQLSPGGATYRADYDIISREIAVTLAISYDLLYTELVENDKRQLREAIIHRTQALFSKFVVDKQHGLMINPFNSHGFLHAGAISVISTLLAGDIEEAKYWFLETFPIYAAIAPPWGGEDGGYANGTNYAVWDAFNLINDWDILKQTIGVDFTRSAWSQEFLKLLTFFLPPGTPTGLFGDGAENFRPNIWKEVGALFAQRIASKEAWVFNLQGDFNPWWNLRFLFGPINSVKAYAENEGGVVLTNSAIMPFTGWVAFHSNIEDSNRTSVYFKSSPYGSYNHSHADQNSFVINSQGQSLAIASGYYDSYWSPHHKNWTIQTKAHNAITMDGGVGQEMFSMKAKGEILEFQEKGEYGYVIGDATQAYGGFLKKSIRTLMYIRPNLVIVYDRLESDSPHQWEWNIHSEVQFREGFQEVRQEKESSSLCIKNISQESLDFQQTNQFPNNPTGSSSQSPSQWHGTYKTKNSKKVHEFLFLLAVNCRQIAVNQMEQIVGGGYSFQITNRHATISTSKAVLRDNSSPPSAPKNLTIR